MKQILLPLLVIALPPSAYGASGGPDAHGYTWSDSNSGVPFEWVDISSTGLEVLTAGSADPVKATIDLEVPWGGIYGQPVSRLQASRNGYLTDLVTGSGNDETNDCPLPAVPSTGGNGFRIYPLHNHIELDASTGQILYQYFPASPHSLHGCGVHVITWDHVYHVGSASETFSFQTLLFDNLDILFQYGAGNPSNGRNSTTGIQNAGATIGLNISCNAREIGDNYAILIQPPELVVNTADDELDAPAGALVSLREAIRDIVDGGRVVLHPSLGGQNSTLTSALSLSGKSIAIDGSRLERALYLNGDGGAATHVEVAGDSWLSCERLHFESATGGSIDVDGGFVARDCVWMANSNTGSTMANGGAIDLAGGEAGFFRCDFFTNSASNFGGAIYANNSRLRAENCRLWRNRSTATSTTTTTGGGAIYLRAAEADLLFCDLAMNIAHDGGALNIAEQVDLSAYACTFDGNRAVDGGAVAFYSQLIGMPSTALFRRCTFFGNCASNRGGSFYEAPVAPVLDLDVWHSTIYKNFAQDAGGAFYLADTQCSVAAIIMADNGDDQLSVQPTRPGGLDTTFLSNIETGNEGNFAASAGLSDVGDIALTDLGYFGGFVRTCMPLRDCPALDFPLTSSAATGVEDARGFPTFRSAAGAGIGEGDVGAVEAGNPVVVTDGDPFGSGSFAEALQQVESGGVITFQSGSAQPVRFVNLSLGGFSIPAGKTVFIDGSPVGGVRMHNFKTDLRDGQNLALHQIHATTAPSNALDRVFTMGDFTAHQCSFTAYPTTVLYTAGGRSSILGTSFCDNEGANQLLWLKSNSTFIARNSQWLNNSGQGSSGGRVLYMDDGVSCIQGCSFVDNAVGQALWARGSMVQNSLRAWLLCENTTFSASGDVVLGSSHTLEPGQTYAELSHNTIVGNLSEAPFRGALTFRQANSNVRATLGGNVIANNAVNTYLAGAPDVDSSGANLSDDAPSFFTAADIPNTAPLLGPPVFGKHGTLVHLPRPGSPCIDAGGSSGVPAHGCYDGRGFHRYFDGDGDLIDRIDIGAAESGLVLIVTTADDESDGINQGNGASMRECVTALYNGIDGVNVGFDPALTGATISNGGGNGGFFIPPGAFADFDGTGRDITLTRSDSTRFFEVNRSVLTTVGLHFDIDRIAQSWGTITNRDATLRTEQVDPSSSGLHALIGCDIQPRDATPLTLRGGNSGVLVILDSCVSGGGQAGGWGMSSARLGRIIAKDSTFSQNPTHLFEGEGGAYFSGCTMSRNSLGILHDSPGYEIPFVLKDCILVNSDEALDGDGQFLSLGGNVLDRNHPALDPDLGDLGHRSAHLAPLADYDRDGVRERPPLAASPAFNSTTGAYRTGGVIVVNTAANQDDTPAGSEVSLREAVRDVPEGGTIIFAPELNGATISAGATLVFDKSLTIDATSLPLGIDLTTRLAWTDGHRLALHGVHIRDVVSGIDGGAIRCIGSGGCFIASHCTFSENTAASGGGIYIQNGELILENCTFSGNETTTASAIHMPNSTGRIEFCTIADGTSDDGVIVGTRPIEFGSNVVFGNRDRLRNIAATFGAGSGFTSLGHNQFEDRTAGTIASDATRQINLPIDFPTFGAFGGWVEGYRAKAGASAIDFTPASMPGIVPPPAHDSRGYVRVAGISADAGALEAGAATEDPDADGLPTWWELLYGLDPSVADDPDSDGDGDGTGLLTEFLWCTHPHDPASFPAASIAPGPSVTFNTVPGNTYLIESSTDLIRWDPDGSILATGDSHTHMAAGGDRRFFRVTKVAP